MATILPRNLGTPAELDCGEWCSDVLRHRPGACIVVHVRCPGCGGIHEVDANDIAQGGKVTHEWKCPTVTCSFEDWIVLESWGEPAFDRSDVRAPTKATKMKVIDVEGGIEAHEFDTLDEAVAALLADAPPGRAIVLHMPHCDHDGEDEDTCTCSPLEMVAGEKS